MFRKVYLFYLLSIFLLFGCTSVQQTTKSPQISAQKITPEGGLKIYPDKSHGKRYDKYDAIVLLGKIVTMDRQEDGTIVIIDSGRVVIDGEKISAVLKKGEKLPNDVDSLKSLFLQTGGIIFPGLLNIHDHMHYNHIPLWNVQDKYTNRYQWSKTHDCKVNVKYAKYVVEQKKYWGLQAEQMKYAEVKQLISGTTAAQGSPNGSKKFCRMLVRNMDVSYNFGFKRMSSYVREVPKVKPEKIDKWIAKMDAGELDAIFFHIAEGTDEKARSEFDFLEENGLARKEVIIIHGTALKEPEIKYMAEHDMTVVWSPVSNLFLYGKTADIPLYKKYGVNITLGTDWSPSGGKNLLGEMKVAYQYSNYYFDSLLTYQDIVEMVTCNPADAVGWTDYCGRIKPGLYADIMVIENHGKNPFEELVNATERDVKLVFIGGDPLYGDSIFMAQMKPGDFEYIETPCGFKKCLDFTKEDVPLGDESFAYVVEMLEKVMAFDEDEMERVFTDKKIERYDSFQDYLDDRFPDYKPLHLDPIYHCIDKHFFDVMRKNKNANLPFDLQEIYYSWVPDGAMR